MDRAKVYLPERAFTKGDLVDFYRRAAELLEPLGSVPFVGNTYAQTTVARR